MKKIILILAIILGCCLTAKAQVPTPNLSDGSIVCVNSQLVYGPTVIDPAATYNFTITPAVPFTVISGGTQIDVTWLAAGVYTIEYDDNDACTIANSAIITVQDVGVITITPIIECDDTGIYSIVSNQAGATYEINSLPVGDFDTDILAPGNYTITASFTDANGCVSTGTEVFTITNPVPLPTISNN